MTDEFDDAFDEAFDKATLRPAGAAGGGDGDDPRLRERVPRLVSRLYRTAGAGLRARMLACLLRPLGLLGLSAVASGAFAGFLHRSGDRGLGVPIDELGRYSNDQIVELARFVEQVSPEAIQQVAGLLADNPVGVAAFSTAVAMLLLRALRRHDPKGATTRRAGDPGS
ncbi:MAG: hypothetical protein KF891_02505 [Rhizobacter sp.]|nr:hypothetical protein [Rhizobacter sp.]